MGRSGRSSLTAAHLVAAGILLLTLFAGRRWLLGSASGLDLRLVPTDDPTVTIVPHPTDGPVLVTVMYEVPGDDVIAFADAMRLVERHRRRTGAYRWGLFRDLAAPHRFIETFVVESWGEHLRQHRRTTVNADRFLDPVQRYRRTTSLSLITCRYTHLPDAPRRAYPARGTLTILQPVSQWPVMKRTMRQQLLTTPDTKESDHDARKRSRSRR